MSALKKKTIIFASVILTFSVISVLLISSSRLSESCDLRLKDDVKVSMESQRLNGQVLDNEQDRVKGLSGRECLHDDDSMIFVFEDESNDGRCFWMKDMNFPIDIIWLDENRRVVDSVLNASPDDYPKVYCPKSASKYVVETAVGRLTKGINIIGQQIAF